jgi:predicted nucleic acid-binding protein
MSIVYFDSSAFVKLIVDEDGSELAAALWDGADAAVSSRLAYQRCARRWPPLSARVGSAVADIGGPWGPGTSSGRRSGRSS